LKAAHAKLAGDHNARHGKLQDLLGREKDAREAHHASVQERLNYLEGLLGDSADKHEQHVAALEAVKSASNKLASEARARAAQHDDKHGSLSERLDRLALDKEKVDILHASMGERVDYIEKVLGDSADKHNRAIEALRVAHAKHATDMATVKEHRSTLEERLNFLEVTLGDSAEKHGKEIESVKGAHAKLLTEAKANHTSVAQRVAELEEGLGAAQRQAQDLKAGQVKLDHLSTRLMAVQAAWKVA